MDGGQEVTGGFVITCGDGTILLEPGKEVLDQVAGFVEFLVVGARVLAVAAGRNDEALAGLLQRPNHTFVGVVGFVSDDGIGRHFSQQDIGAIQIAGLPRCQKKTGRVTQGIDGGVDFCAQSSARAADGLRFAPFLPAPALC